MFTIWIFAPKYPLYFFKDIWVEVPHNSMGHHEARPLRVKPRPVAKLRLVARIRQDARQAADMILLHCTMNIDEDDHEEEEIVVLL
mgnify:FL=1